MIVLTAEQIKAWEDLSTFIEDRRDDIEQEVENFGLLKPLLRWLDGENSK